MCLAMIWIGVVYCTILLEGGHQKRGAGQERVEMELLKCAEDVTRNMVEAPKP